MLLLLLAATGCAIDPPRPELPPPATESAPAAPLATVPLPVISGFGEYRGEGGGPNPLRHAGIDIRAPVGTSVLAAASGIVIRTGSQANAGRLIVVAHAENLSTVYFHLSAVEVTAGQTVQRGDAIGRVGTTGNATTPHLHFGVCRRDGALCGERIEAGWQDPARYWVAGNPCHVAGRVYAYPETRLTYPLPCRSWPPSAGAAPLAVTRR